MASEKIYKMTFIRHLSYIYPSLLYFLLFPVLYVYALITGHANAPFILVLILWMLSGFMYINGFRLHLSYYQADRDKQVTIGNSTIEINNITEFVTFKFDDIASITNCHCGRRNSTTWNNYNFSIFKLKDGKEFIVTCLIMDLVDIKKVFPDTPLVEKNFFFASLYKK